MRWVWGTLLAAICAAGCYDPSLGPCAVACAEGDTCPGALTCMADGFCHAVGDAPTCMPDATPGPDAAPPEAYVQVVGGSRHTCAITMGGALQCWGTNVRSQVGEASAGRRTGRPTTIDGEGWTRVDAGTNATCAIQQHQLWCWGANDSAQAAQTGTSEVTIPTRVDPTGPEDFLEVAIGSAHGCAIRGLADARLFCWGSDLDGRLGDGAADASGAALTEVAGGFSDWLMVSAGDSHTCALRATNQLYCWGLGTHGELGTDDSASHDEPTEVAGDGRFRFVAAGRNTTCAITVDGELDCWGDNSSHQLGIATGSAFDLPTRVGTQNGWTSVAMQFYGACGARAGRVSCWGLGAEGELGNGTFADASTPVEITTLAGATSVGAGDYHACAIVAGALQCWGSDSDGQLGTGTIATKYVPTQIGTDEDWDDVAAGQDFTCGIRAGGLYCWGRNDTLQLGVGSPAQSPAPVRIGAATTWRSVGVGTQFGCALLDGTPDELWCWGSDSDGQLGNGSSMGNRVATHITNPGGVTSWDLLAVGPHAACTTSTTSRYCWGEGAEGQLGNGGTADLDAPTLVASETIAWARLSLGYRVGAGIAGTDIYTWGRDDQGQLGNGAPGAHLSPTTIINNGWTDVTAAFDGNHMCGVGNGSVACWGDNGLGKLGNGDTDPRSVPSATIDVNNPQSYSDVEAGATHTCAIHAEGLYCWGNDANAQLGNEGLYPYATMPSAVVAPSLRSLSTGATHTCAITMTGALYCWGENAHGQLGDGTEAKSAPVPIATPG